MGFITPIPSKGTTAKLIPYSPQQEINQYLRWKTTVNTSVNGVEYAQKNRQIPQRSYKYTYILNRIDAAKLESLLFNPELIYLPLWDQKQRLGISALTGSSYVENAGIFITTGFDYSQYVMIYKNKSQYELKTILSVTADRITFTENIQKDYDNPYIIPVYKAIILGLPSWTMTANNDFMQCEIDYMLISNSALTSFSPTYSHSSFMVLAESNNYMQSLSRSATVDTKMIITDFELGQIDYYKNFFHSLNIKSWGFRAQGRTEILSMLAKLNYLSGQQCALWIPILQRDFEPVNNIDSVDTVISVRNKFLSEIWAAEGLDRAVMIWHEGTYYFKNIVSITEDTDTIEEIEIDTPLGVNIDIAKDSFLICWLFKGCLNSDQINITYTNDQAYCKVDFRELINPDFDPVQSEALVLDGEPIIFNGEQIRF